MICCEFVIDLQLLALQAIYGDDMVIFDNMDGLRLFQVTEHLTPSQFPNPKYSHLPSDWCSFCKHCNAHVLSPPSDLSTLSTSR